MDNDKNYGYGTWEVVCPYCSEKRLIRSHKYKNGKIRGEVNGCQPCRAKRLRRRVLITCPACKGQRELTPSDAKQRITQYCKHCAKKAVAPTIKNGMRVFITSRGYAKILGVRDHPLADASGQALEHWYVLYNEHPMGKESVIWFKNNAFTLHHLNGNRVDNRLENLDLRAPGKHPRGWSIDDMRKVIEMYDGLGDG